MVKAQIKYELSSFSKNNNAVAKIEKPILKKDIAAQFQPTPDDVKSLVRYNGVYLDSNHYFNFKDSSSEDLTMCGEPEFSSRRNNEEGITELFHMESMKKMLSDKHANYSQREMVNG